MKVIRAFGGGKPVFSFEFFLPKSPEGMVHFRSAVAELKALGPSFVTLTYGAGGSARDRTIETAGMIQNELGLETVAHLTCIAHTRTEIEEILKKVRGHGIENLMLLRGDPPRDGAALPPERRGYRHAADLVRHAKAFGGFCIGVAGYPEKHPESADRDEDLAHLKEKVEAGADFVTTQLFFDNEAYFKFVDSARSIGIRVPILPGLMPVTNVGQLKKFAAMCGAVIPPAMARDLSARAGDADFVVHYGIDWTYRQAKDLLSRGAPGVHFYTLNKSRSTAAILSRLLT